MFKNSRGVNLKYPITKDEDTARKDNWAFFTGYMCALLETPEEAENVTVEEKLTYMLIAKSKAEYLRRERERFYDLEEAKDIIRTILYVDSQKMN